ncbi:NAD-dependent epimerase/dehydratase family protein [Devosia sp. ZB163]|uniref:NAD-dependent epimerase/dehydratase family protein n=1 Tax=Devosia sp. ZB163 TaxID=3025938 RepID=UPI00235FA0C7|nr:NAD-dependent epimerase/dehydratase family protein [Devosia sp. ZB163]MDC9823525.1 NAD-dependent epimerase/dehydratase family protein [Devosia sp. ZB163]
MTIAIISGTGFLGTATARRLRERGADVLVVARGKSPVALPDGVKFEKADRMDSARIAELLKANGVTAVIDIFALSLKNSEPVIEAAAKAGARYILVSSTDVYSNYGGLLKKEAPPVRPDPATEDSPLRALRYPYRGNPRRPQGVEDDLFENYDKIPIEEYALAHGAPEATVMRLPMIFGPDDKQHRFGWAIKGAKKGEPFRLDRRGAGWLNSYAYIDDVAEALTLAALSPEAAGRVYNVAQPFVRTQADWARTILTLMGLDSEIVLVDPADNGVLADRADSSDLAYPLTLDSQRIRAELGYSEIVPEEQALRRTIEWELSQG